MSTKNQRYLYSYILKDLKKKMVILSGPRQSGKTTLAKSLLKEKKFYLNYDIQNDRKIIKDISFDENTALIVLDELHKMNKWKNYLKGLYDDRHQKKENKQSFLVTGSARLETFKRQGDALTGRFFSYHLHPLCPAEIIKHFSSSSKISISTSASDLLLSRGGFPEAFFNPKDADRLRNERFNTVINEDLRDLSRVGHLRQFLVLLEILQERGPGQLSYSSLAEDLSVSVPTVINWIEWLERLYLIFRIYPWSKSTARSFKKEPKFYFYDCAASFEAGPKLENLVACSLIKHADFLNDVFGRKIQVQYFRDKEKREVDFVVMDRNKPLYFIEVKTASDELSPSLLYLKNKYPEAKAIQLIYKNFPEKDSKTIKDCLMTNLNFWLAKNLLQENF